jgi:DnaJ-class molecular chaperone
MKKWLALLSLPALIFIAPGVQAQIKGGFQKCTICHSKPELKKTLETGRVISLYVDVEKLGRSVHAKKECTDCHSDIVEIPHKGRKILKVNCTQCHYRGNPVGAPQTDKYVEYAKSVHGLAVAAGNQKAPICQDCHGDHDIINNKNPASHLFKKSIPKTCGQCHLEIYRTFQESVHGESLQEGKLDAPACTDCHGEHSIKSHENPESTVYMTRIPQTCSKCHSAIGIVGKYGIETEQVKTFEESFHGVAIKFGAKTVANCASCHGVHDIRKKDDPKSLVSIQNIPKTCGKCHPGANINYAKGKIHIDATKKEAGIVYWVAFFFKWLTIGTMVGLMIHIGMDLFRRYRSWKSKAH